MRPTRIRDLKMVQFSNLTMESKTISKNEQSFKSQTFRKAMQKIIFLFSGLFCSLILFSQNQASIENLRQENAKLMEQIAILKQDTVYLRQVISTCDLLKKSGDYLVSNSNKEIKIEVLSCTGDRNFQTVTVEFMISHQLPHQRLYIDTGQYAPTAFDNLGNTFKFKSVDFKENFNKYLLGDVDVIVPTGIRIKGSITYSNVLPSMEQFSLARFDYHSHNQDDRARGNRHKVEIRNIPIIWQ